MPGFEYTMVQMPPTVSVQAKNQQGNEAALYLQNLANQYAGQGWEFYRVDTVGVVVRPGCLASLVGGKTQHFEYYVVTFRRPK